MPASLNDPFNEGVNVTSSAARYRLFFVARCVSIAGAIASTSSGGTPNVVSRPAGFLRVIVPSNTQVLASQPFLTLAEGNAMSSVEVLKWDAQSGYVASSSSSVVPGEGFWLVNRAASNQDVYLAGEVVLAPSNTSELSPGLRLVSYPYSSSLPLQHTALGELTGQVDVLTAESRPPGENESTLGKGFWVKSFSSDSVVWTEMRPYDDIFPSNVAPPIIQGVGVMQGGTGVVLSILCEGTPGETLDIFYQDMSPTGRFESAGQWQVADSAVAVNGQREVTWRDVGGNGRPQVDKVLGRYYLVGRADIDLDADGSPDARELVMAGETEGGAANAKALFSLSRQKNLGIGVAQSQQGQTVFVDASIGDDGFDGLSSSVASGHGPKKSISAAISVASTGGCIEVAPGVYRETVFATGGKNVALRTGKGVFIVR